MTMHERITPSTTYFADLAAPPRMTVNRSVYEVAAEAARRGMDLPGLHLMGQWEHHVTPLGLSLLGPSLAAQGDDFARGMLLFAEEKHAPDEEAWPFWIGAHLATCFGCFEAGDQDADRVTAAEEREDLWRSIARDPLSDLSWTKAPRPWSTLAAAIEWVRFMDNGKPTFRSGLPVTLDAFQINEAGFPRLPGMDNPVAFYSFTAAARAFNLTVANFGNGLFATHASDVFMLAMVCLDTFRDLARYREKMTLSPTTSGESS